jgi:hypothetical protein
MMNYLQTNNLVLILCFCLFDVVVKGGEEAELLVGLKNDGN